MKTKSPSPDQQCIFCGSSTNLTDEHVLPNWLRKVIPRLADSSVHLGISSETLGGTMLLKPELSSIAGNIGSRKVFMVCAVCNNGWMSALQNEAKPHLTKLIVGDWQTFDERVGQIISRWAAMTTSVIAMSFPNTLGVTKADRHFIRDRREPPENWQIFVGRGSGFEDIEYSNRIATTVTEESRKSLDQTEPNTNVTTIALGQLIIHTINVPVARLLAFAETYGVEVGVFPIHPWSAKHLDWRAIPVLHRGSENYHRLKNEMYDVLMKALGIPQTS